MNTADADIAIVGAGLGGLTAALALQRAGFTVRVFEQTSVLGEVGAGISISQGPARALASLGLGPALLAASLPVPDVAFAHYRTGELLAGTFDQGRPADRGLDGARHIHRADLHALLLAAVQAADPEAVHTGRRLVGLAALEGEPGEPGATAHFADGTVWRCRVLLGADGTRSTVRRLCFDDSPPQFSGQVAYRCLVPRALAQPYLGGGNALVTVGPGRSFHRYLLRGGELVNVVGIVQSAAWQGEGWNTPATVDEFAAAFADFHADVRGLIQQAPAHSLIKWALAVRPPLACWHRGAVGLLGDAAHPILPFLGLGAALAIEDGIVLARALQALPGYPALALAAYQAARAPRVERVRQQSILQGLRIQAADPDRVELERSPSQDASLFEHDPCTVPLPLPPGADRAGRAAA